MTGFSFILKKNNPCFESKKGNIRKKRICCPERSLSCNATQYLELLSFLLEWTTETTFKNINMHLMNIYSWKFINNSGDIYLRSFFSSLLHTGAQALSKVPSYWVSTDRPPPGLRAGVAAHATLAPKTHGKLHSTEWPSQHLSSGSSQSKRNERVGCGCAYSPLLSLWFMLHHLPWATNILWKTSAHEWKVHFKSCWTRNTQFEKLTRSPCYN